MNDVTKIQDQSLPAHLQGGKKASFGKIDQSDLIIPRVKLLQSTSEEITTLTERGAKIGVFWHTLAEQSLGDNVRIIPLILQKSLALWAPRGDDRGILARSTDLVNWDGDGANKEFTVKLKGSKEPITYYTKGSVAESRLAEFGSSVPGDDNSRPAASLTYRMMFYFPDHPDLSPAIVINTRSSLRPAKALISKIEMKPVDHYGQVYEMGVTDEKGDEGPYKGYKYTSAGYASELDYDAAKAVFQRFEGLEWKSNDEHDDGNASDGSSKGGASESNKF